jgi:hypothetical protein
MGVILTNFPPPPGFDLYQNQEPGDQFYQRELTPEEEVYWEAHGEDEAWEVRCMGDTIWRFDRATLLPTEPGLSGPSAAKAAEPQEERSEASEACGESRPGPADGSAPAEPDRRHGLAGTPAAAAKPPPAGEKN